MAGLDVAWRTLYRRWLQRWTGRHGNLVFFAFAQYSFTQYVYLHWIGPMFGLVLIGCGIFAVFNSVRRPSFVSIA